MDDLLFNQIIEDVEHKWFGILYRGVEKEFNNNPLPSHDHTHHLRVWFFAKELLRELFTAGCEFNQSDIQKIIFAVFFHDVGLTRTLNADHGKESRKICEKFLKEKGIDLGKISDEVFNAIEMHDDKSYINKRNKINTYTVLTIADDLDAYGAIGVYRYYEIYRLRKIESLIIPRMVIENLENRFGFLNEVFGFLENFIRQHFERKQYTSDYYSHVAFKPDLEILEQIMKKAFKNHHGIEFLIENESVERLEESKLITDIRKELIIFSDVYNKIKGFEH